MVDEARAASSGGSGGSPSAAPAVDPLLGRSINDRYRIVSLLAKGGMGRVYRAEQAPLGRAVALKVLHPNYKGEHDPEFHKRFFLEAATCAKLTHPNTVTIFDYGRTDDDVYFIAMELLEGRTLHRALREEGPFDAHRALHITRQICRSLREAHNMRVAHRDLKPANVFLVEHDEERDFVKVLDFGLVKNTEEGSDDLTQTGLFMGSPKYMAPEQIQGERTDGRVDIYAMGVILYEMLCGKVPFDRPNSVNILMAHVHEAPPSFAEMAPGREVPASVEAIVMRCLAKRPDERFATMDELLRALKLVSDSGSLTLSGSRELSLDEVSSALARSDVPIPSATPPSLTSSDVLRRIPPPAPVPQVEGYDVPVDVAPPATEPRRGPPMFALAAGLAALVAVGLGAAYLATRASAPTATPGSSSPASSTPSTEPIPTPPAPPLAPPTSSPEVTPPTSTSTPPSAPAAVQLVVRSTPAGASVRLGDQRLGVTPLDVALSEPAAEGQALALVVMAPGYAPQTVRAVVHGGRAEVEARLVRRAAGGDAMGMSTEATGTHVDGYRDDPY